jgi:hypothetical protein
MNIRICLFAVNSILPGLMYLMQDRGDGGGDILGPDYGTDNGHSICPCSNDLRGVLCRYATDGQDRNTDQRPQLGQTFGAHVNGIIFRAGGKHSTDA